MKSYQDKKKEWINSLSPMERDFIISRSEEIEKMIEEQIRSNIGPLANFIQSLNKLIDTKKESVREDILDFILNNPDTMRVIKENINILINITRL